MPRQTLTVQLMHANARIASLEAELNAEREAHGVAKRTLHAALEQSAAKPSAPASKPQAGNYPDYWDYVRAVRKWAHASGKPVSYLGQTDWAIAREEVTA